VEQLTTRPQQNHRSTVDDIAWSKSISLTKRSMILPGEKPTFELGASSEELVGIGNDTGNLGAV